MRSIRRPFRSFLVPIGCLVLLSLLVVYLFRERHTEYAFSASSFNVDLYLPSEPPEGSYGDLKEGQDPDVERRQIGIELSHREECGPIRCRLRAIRDAAAMTVPELEVELGNASHDPITLQGHQGLLDYMTFIFRDPDDQVVSSCSPVLMHSVYLPAPAVILKPGESASCTIHLFHAAEHGFQPLRPGLYSIEAVFENHDFLSGPMPISESRMFARSNRLSVRVQ
jgi:hypothetical protein